MPPLSASQLSAAGLAKTIDHSLLRPTSTNEQLDAGIEWAVAHEVASVCILPFYLKRCAERLKGTTVLPSTVIGFPHGCHTTALKRAESALAISEGCAELDVVVNLSQVLSGNWAFVHADLRAVIDTAHSFQRKVKVIFETCELDDSQKIRLCELCSELGADWVKTSTGFGRSGATVADVTLLRTHSAPQVQVKASGGIRDLATATAMLAAGATRLGTSSSADLLRAAGSLTA